MPNEYKFVRYRSDVGELVDELRKFVDEADPAVFDDIITQLGDVVRCLELAQGYEGLASLRVLLLGWRGEASYNFQERVLNTIDPMLWHQAKLVEEIARAAWVYKEIIERGRGDALGLTQDLKRKVEIGGGGLNLGTVLWLVGSVAAGVATFGASTPATAAVWAGRIAYAAGTAREVFAGIEGAGSRRDEADRAIEGDYAEEFIPSCWKRISEVKAAGNQEATDLLNGLSKDLGDDAIDQLTMDRPKIIGADSIDDLGAADDSVMDRDTGLVEVGSIADLKAAGEIWLPTMAQYLHDACWKVERIPFLFDRAIGDSVVASPDRYSLEEIITILADALGQARDFLYDAGQALSAAADLYFQTDEQNQAMLELFNARLAEVNFDEFPAYSPPTPQPSGNDPVTV
jgi:hypothetical protein